MIAVPSAIVTNILFAMPSQSRRWWPSGCRPETSITLSLIMHYSSCFSNFRLIVVGGLKFYRNSSFSSIFFFFFFRQLPSELAERNSAKIGHMLLSECNLKMNVRNMRYHVPLQIWDPKSTYFRRLSQLNGKFNGLYLQNETWYTQSVKCAGN